MQLTNAEKQFTKAMMAAWVIPQKKKRTLNMERRK